MMRQSNWSKASRLRWPDLCSQPAFLLLHPLGRIVRWELVRADLDRGQAPGGLGAWAAAGSWKERRL